MTEPLELLPLDALRYGGWRERRLVKAIDAFAAAGMSSEQAAARAERDFMELFPDGYESADQHVLRVLRNGTDIGFVWLQVRRHRGGADSMVHEFGLERSHSNVENRDAVFAAVEKFASERGASSVRLKAPFAAVQTFQDLGYAITVTTMSMRLDQTDAPDFRGLPPLELRPMTDEQFDSFIEDVRRDVATGEARAGVVSEGDTSREGRSGLDRLPDGKDTPGQNFLVGLSDGEPVARLWVTLQESPSGLNAYANYMDIEPSLRGRQLGKAMVASASSMLRTMGVREVRFRIYGFNQAARSLVEAVGFKTTEAQLLKVLEPSA